MLSRLRITGLLCLAACAHGSEAAPANRHSPGIAHYTVTIFDELDGARVRACFEGVAMTELVPMDESAARELRGASIDGDSLQTRNGRIPLSQASPPACVDYETRFGDSRFRRDDPSTVILSQTQWLWRPNPFPSELDASVRFVLPENGQASLPWPQSDGVYFPDASVFFAETYGVFGKFERQALSVAGARLEIARLGDRPPDDHIRRWLGRAVQTVASVGDRFPRDRLHFVIVPVDSPAEEVVFGMVRRGGGLSILLLPSSYAGVVELEADWVAIHELSHLWLPRLQADGRWLSEGIATYLQEVLRARCGLQSSEQAWRRLREGFGRGRRSGTGRRLASESQSMNRTGAYQRVYWAGAAFALETDVRLRQLSNGQTTLLTALNNALGDWRASSGPVSASRVLGALDKATGAAFIENLGTRYASNPDFPDTAYVDAPAYRDLRAQITSPAHRACGISGESFQ